MRASPPWRPKDEHNGGTTVCINAYPNNWNYRSKIKIRFLDTVAI